VWLRHGLETFQKRLKALEERVAHTGEVLTECQLRALEKAQEEKIAWGEGGGPRCLDSLMGGISSESVFGFFVLLLRSIRLPQRRDEAVRNRPHPGCGRQERSGRVRGCKSRSIRLAPAAVRNRS